MDFVVVVLIGEIIVKYGDFVLWLCNKDFLIFRNFSYLVRIFFKFKFVFMVRDGCVVVYFIMERGVVICGVNNCCLEIFLRIWNDVIGEMNV